MESRIKVISSRKIYEVLDSIKARPELWLTSKSITALQNFLNGYMQLGFSEDIYHPGEPSLNDDFKYWFLTKHEGIGVGNSYSTVLLRECHGDEEKAFDRFFEYLHTFKKEQTKS